jgi:hypothetical protein
MISYVVKSIGLVIFWEEIVSFMMPLMDWWRKWKEWEEELDSSMMIWEDTGSWMRNLKIEIDLSEVYFKAESNDRNSSFLNSSPGDKLKIPALPSVVPRTRQRLSHCATAGNIEAIQFLPFTQSSWRMNL